MSDCSPKYHGRNSPPYPFKGERRGKGRRKNNYSHYYLSRAYDSTSPPNRWIKEKIGDISYRKPRKKSKKKSRRKRSVRKSSSKKYKKSIRRSKPKRSRIKRKVRKSN